MSFSGMYIREEYIYAVKFKSLFAIAGENFEIYTSEMAGNTFTSSTVALVILLFGLTGGRTWRTYPP